MKILQTNLGLARLAHDVAFITAAEKKMDINVVSPPTESDPKQSEVEIENAREDYKTKRKRLNKNSL